MKRLLFILTALLSLPLWAQEEGNANPADTTDTPAQTQVQPALRFGYLSYQEVLESMPGMATVRRQMADLRSKYEQELKRVEDEFNQKYEAFLEGRNDFPRTILLKRQTELQDLMQQNVEFRKKGLQELEAAEAEAMEPLHQLLQEVIAACAKSQKLAFVLNTDGNACPFIDPAYGVDIQLEVTITLGTWGNAIGE